jgi:hypothetical protein
VAESREQIISDCVSGRKHRPLAQPRSEHVQVRCTNRRYELCKPSIGHDRPDRLGRRAEERPEGSETADQRPAPGSTAIGVKGS